MKKYLYASLFLILAAGLLTAASRRRNVFGMDYVQGLPVDVSIQLDKKRISLASEFVEKAAEAVGTLLGDNFPNEMSFSTVTVFPCGETNFVQVRIGSRVGPHYVLLFDKEGRITSTNTFAGPLNPKY